LILDGGNSTLVSPIDGVGEGLDVKVSSQRVSGNFLSVVFEVGSGSIDLLEFSGSQVSELVDGILNTFTFGIESGDLVEVFNEDTESGDFFRSGVSLLVLSLPGRPEGRESISSGSGGDASDSKESNAVVFVIGNYKSCNSGFTSSVTNSACT